MIEPLTLEVSDNLLALSRRLDWRFVFADPNLKHVVVAGTPDDELLNAVTEFSDCVTIWQGQSIEACDILVMHNPSFSQCRRALTVIRPERFYAEFEGNRFALRLQKALFAAWCVFGARRGRYRRIRSFWHWPDIVNANRIIPLSQSEAVSFVVTKGRSGLKARLKRAGVNLLRGTGLLMLIIKGLGMAGERRA